MKATVSVPSAPPSAYEERIPLAQPVLLDEFDSINEVHSSSSLVHRGYLVENVLRLSCFHGANLVLGLLAFAFVTVGSSLSVGLLPLCCFGIVVFRLTMYGVYYFVELDVKLQNWLVPPSQRVNANVPPSVDWLSLTSAKPAFSISCQSINQLIYFVTIKFVVAIISAAALGLTFAFPVTTFAVKHMRRVFFKSATGSVGFVLITVLLLLLGTAFMNFTADISRHLTRRWCGLRYGYAHDYEGNGAVLLEVYGAVEKPQAARA